MQKANTALLYSLTKAHSRILAKTFQDRKVHTYKVLSLTILGFY